MNKSQKRAHTARVRRDQEDRRLSNRPIHGYPLRATGKLRDDFDNAERLTRPTTTTPFPDLAAEFRLEAARHRRLALVFKCIAAWFALLAVVMIYVMLM